jgi:hypothetical protein
LNPSAVLSRASQGRPAGTLLAWLKCAADFPDQASHNKALNDRHILLPSLSFAARAEARAWAETHHPEFAAFLAAHEAPQRGDHPEPADPA